MENIAKTSSPQLKTYSKSERNWYLTGVAGQNIMYNIVGAALAYYLQFTLLIPAIAVGVIMTIARVWDAFNDPLMGTIVDRTRTKFGKCRPYLMVLPIPIMIITILCFTNFGFYGENQAPNGLIIFWAAFTYILWGMIYTIADIPMWSASSLMTESEKDKTKILSAARIFAAIGGGIAMLGIQPLAFAIGKMLTKSATNGDAALGEKYGFLVAAVIFAVIGTALFIPLGYKVKEKIPAKTEKTSLGQNFKIGWRNKPFRQIILSSILGSTKMLIALAAMPIITYYFSSKSPALALLYMVLLGGGFFLGQFIGNGLTPTLLKITTTKKLYNFSNLVGIFPFLFIFVAYLLSPSGLTGTGWVILCFILFMICGISMGITFVLQSTMIASAVDYEDYTNNIRPDAVFFSGQTFVTKLQTGIATFISSIAYTIVGFSDARVAEINAYITAGGTPRMVGEFASFMMILFFIVSILPAIGCILSIIPTWKYALDDNEHKKIIAILSARRNAEHEGKEFTKEDEDKISQDVARQIKEEKENRKNKKKAKHKSKSK